MVDPISTGAAIVGAIVSAKPLDRLIEVTAAGLGRLYEPTAIRRRARAEGDALIIAEETQAKLADVRERAKSRLLANEERRQLNIEAIVENAASMLPDSVPPEPPDPDWMAKFFNNAQDVSNQEMRILWGKLLSNEIARPGSFSTWTLSIVSMLTHSDAALFQHLCGRVVKIDTFTPHPLTKTLSVKAIDGLTLSDLQHLQALGLISVENFGTNKADYETQVLIELPDDVIYLLQSPSPMRFNLGCLSLTKAGRELFRVAEWKVNVEQEHKLVDWWSSCGWTIERHRVIERLPNGRLLHVPVEE